MRTPGGPGPYARRVSTRPIRTALASGVRRSDVVLAASLLALSLVVCGSAAGEPPRSACWSPSSPSCRWPGGAPGPAARRRHRRLVVRPTRSCSCAFVVARSCCSSPSARWTDELASGPVSREGGGGRVEFFFSRARGAGDQACSAPGWRCRRPYAVGRVMRAPGARGGAAAGVRARGHPAPCRWEEERSRIVSELHDVARPRRRPLISIQSEAADTGPGAGTRAGSRPGRRPTRDRAARQPRAARHPRACSAHGELPVTTDDPGAHRANRARAARLGIPDLTSPSPATPWPDAPQPLAGGWPSSPGEPHGTARASTRPVSTIGRGGRLGRRRRRCAGGRTRPRVHGPARPGPGWGCRHGGADRAARRDARHGPRRRCSSWPRLPLREVTA